MAINFPNNPSTSDSFTINGSTYVFDGVFWNSLGSPQVGPTGPVGPVGPTGPQGPLSNVLYDGGEPSTDFSVGFSIDAGEVT